jgi:hypothetical protein
MKIIMDFQRQVINHILIRCARLNPYAKILLLFIFSVSVIIFFFYFLYADLETEKNSLINEVNNLSEKLRQQKSDPKKNVKNKPLYTALKNTHSKNRNDIFKLIDETAKKSNISLISIKPGEYEQKFGVPILHYHLNISGEYPEIIHFLTAFMGMAELVSFSNIRLTTTDSTGELYGALLFILDMQVYGKRQ